MNRLVLIGNGFDLAHNLNTRYEDFINWYWEQRVHDFFGNLTSISKDPLCTFEIYKTNTIKCWNEFAFQCQNFFHKKRYNEIIKLIFKRHSQYYVIMSPFFKNILKSLETKRWVDIENEYYDLLKKYALEEDGDRKIDELNRQLCFLQEKLVEYLSEIEIKENIIKSGIRSKIYEPFNHSDIAIGGQAALEEHVKNGLKLDERELTLKLQPYGDCYSSGRADDYRRKWAKNEKIEWDCVPKDLLLPNQILLLNFNYTKTAQFYCKNASIFNIIQIHGELEHPSSVIFGYGDELDEDYKKIMNKNDNRYLGNIKSVKYLESDNYRKLLDFIESEPYQIIIMGHSCGNSDRTLLNTLFEHKNCVSIKPYYYKNKETGKDNYLDIIQNISRNFNDMKLMRDRVVNRTYCEPLT